MHQKTSIKRKQFKNNKYIIRIDFLKTCYLELDDFPNCILNNITGKTMADIGNDHAYIPIKLTQDNKIVKAIACDIKEGPLSIAKKNWFLLTELLRL